VKTGGKDRNKPIPHKSKLDSSDWLLYGRTSTKELTERASKRRRLAVVNGNGLLQRPRPWTIQCDSDSGATGSNPIVGSHGRLQEADPKHAAPTPNPSLALPKSEEVLKRFQPGVILLNAPRHFWRVSESQGPIIRSMPGPWFSLSAGHTKGKRNEERPACICGFPSH